MKEFKEKWLKELDMVVPKLRQDVLDAPILVGDVEQSPSPKRKFNFSWKWFTACVSGAVAAVLTLIIAFNLIGGSPDNPPPTIENSYFAVLEVNPEVMFTIDENGAVVSVTALNSDADVVIADSDRLKSLVGVPFEESAKTFIDICAKLGYLKLDESGAVKITHSGDGENISSAVSKIENYFKEKGVFSVVLTAKATIEEISNKLNLGSLQSFDDVVGALKSLPSLFTERSALGKTIEEIQSSYKQNVILGDMQDYIIEKLNRGLTSGEKLEEIYTLNESIKAHQDNPLFFVGGVDYWALQSLDREFSDELSLIMEQMGQKLQEFELNYGVALDSISLNANHLLFAMVDKQFVSEIITSANEEDYINKLPFIKALLQENGVGLEFEDDFDSLPTTVEEFLNKNSNYLSRMYAVCEKDNLSSYETQRESISDGDYQTFLNNIIGEYGSLEGYWVSLKS